MLIFVLFRYLKTFSISEKLPVSST
jgi:hypothetical protein